MVSAACAQATETAAVAAWLDDAQRYCAQQAMSVDYGYGSEGSPTDAGKISFRELLGRLPEPRIWPELARAAQERQKALPAEKVVERQRLEAARWLLVYLGQGKGAALAALPETLEKGDGQEYGAGAMELVGLRESLEAGEEGGSGRSFAEQVKAFEDALGVLGEVSEERLSELVGGPEKFAAFKRMIATQKEIQARTKAISGMVASGGDAKAARAELEKVELEFSAKHGAEMAGMRTLMSNQAVRLYYIEQFQEAGAAKRERAPMDVQVPDNLVRRAGAERAEALLRRALALPARLEVDEADVETLQLGRRLALELVETLRVAQWDLTAGESGGALFEALKRRFPKQASLTEHAYTQALVWRIVGLVKEGRIGEALTMSDEVKNADVAGRFSLPYQALEKLDTEEEGRFVDFFLGRVRKNPSEEEWNRLVLLAAKTGRTEELTEIVDTLVADGGVRGLSRLVVQRMKAESELAQERIDAAVARMMALIAEPLDGQAERAQQATIAMRLLGLAELRGGAEMEAVIAAGDALLKKAWEGKSEEALTAAIDWMRALNRAGRHAEAARVGERVIGEVVAEESKTAGKRKAWERGLSQSYRMEDFLAEQLCALVEAGRVEEAGALLQENAWWQAGDVAGLLYKPAESTKRPVGFYAGKVALAQGDREKARRIFEAQVIASPACDAAYAAWLELAGMEALPLLEKLAAADRYEERPLIWKAHLLIEARRWAEAEVVLRAAIAIDPSDGEQGRGDRMRVYAFMARVMTGKGDGRQAAFFEDVVKAIRLSERADRWFEVGAYARAIALYRESLGFFADAYCIQSRLAVRLSKEGKVDEAAAHYQKAFELMPDSFGRVESHCFGCEKVFEGEKTQRVAEEVFMRMLEARPEMPQLHYLLGYLNEERGRIAEAAGFYRAAVKRDPLYLNAWKRLSELDERAGLTAAERDELAITVFALDPARRHGSPALEKVGDLPRLWRALAAAEKQLEALKPAGALWELRASAVALRAAKTPGNPWSSGRVETLDFAGVVARSRFGQAWQAYAIALAKAGR